MIMAKILFISNMAKKVGSFSVASIAAAQKGGFEFYFAANWSEASAEQIAADEKKYNIKIICIDLARSPYSIQNIKAYKQLVNLIKKEHIDYIHCNTPVGGMLGRLVGEKCKVKKVIYQVHGFHFYNGARKKNWLVYYPIEKWLARKTDAIITINKEDYERAKKFKLRNNGNVYYVPGVGIDLSNYEQNSAMREKKRDEFKLKDSDLAIISAGELNTNKNNKVIIEAIARLQKVNIHYYLCGKGPCEEQLKKLAQERNLDQQIHFLGYRTDVGELLQASDIFVMPSYREGLSRSIMEAMACGLPCIVSNIRGNSDLVQDDIGGYLLAPDDIDGFANVIQMFIQQPDLFVKMKYNNLKNIKNFSINVVIKKLTNIYLDEFKENQ